MNPGCFCLLSRGCRSNQVEGVAIAQALAESGWQRLASWQEQPELVIVNSCTVTAEADRHLKQLLRRIRREAPHSLLVLTGCYPQAWPGAACALPETDYVLDNYHKAFLPDYMRQRLQPLSLGQDLRQCPATPFLAADQFRQQRPLVQVQTGCDAYCHYCIVPYVRGPSRSRAAEEVVAQVQRLATAGYAEVVLTGIHIGTYGQDMTPSMEVADLVALLLEQTAIPRLRLGSLEPLEVSPKLLALMVGEPRLCRHLHIPVQSLSDKVLTAMGRPYSAEQFGSLCRQIKEQMPEVALGTDILVGFPGEDGAAFAATCQRLQELPLAYGHVFSYSPRSGTVAARRGQQVSHTEKKRRSQQLRQLIAKKKQAFAQRSIHKPLEVVVESLAGNEGHGTSSEFLGVRFAVTAGLQQGQMVPVIGETVAGQGELTGHIAGQTTKKSSDAKEDSNIGAKK